jgi:hypothetical protein
MGINLIECSDRCKGEVDVHAAALIVMVMRLTGRRRRIMPGTDRSTRRFHRVIKITAEAQPAERTVTTHRVLQHDQGRHQDGTQAGEHDRVYPYFIRQHTPAVASDPFTMPKNPRIDNIGRLRPQSTTRHKHRFSHGSIPKASSPRDSDPMVLNHRGPWAQKTPAHAGAGVQIALHREVLTGSPARTP